MSLPKNRSANRSKRREGRVVDARGHQALLQATQEEMTRRPVKAKRTPIKALTEAQARYDASIRANTITFGIGPAGTGKTWLATMRAAEMLDKGEVSKLIITRPALEAAGENLGFLPGEIDDKFGPFFKPVKIELEHYFGSGALEYMIKNGIIETSPLAYLRGHTFKDAVVLFDEAQNATVGQMKMFLTRIGENAKIIIEGDPRQNDLPAGVKSGLTDAMHRLRHIKGVGVVEFDHDDIVRSGICKEIVLAYDDAYQADRTTREPETEITIEESLSGLHKTLRISVEA